MLNIDDGNFATEIDVHLSGLTLTGGDVSDDGGGILSFENLTLNAMTISNNAAAFSGGGIYADSGQLTVINSTISDNSSLRGGGVAMNFLNGGGTGFFTNTTISGNSSSNIGGGIYMLNLLIRLTNSTVVGNSAGGGDTSSAGGGIYSGGLVELNNSIVAGNSAVFASLGADLQLFDDGADSADSSNSLIGDANGHSITSGVDGNLVGVDWTTVVENDGANPVLQDNGGPTPTIALIPGSPAIDAGDDALAVDATGNPLTTDQRGDSFTRFNGIVDMGAFETGTIQVDTDENTDDGDLSQGDVSLREAIGLANADPGPNTIVFDPAFFNAATPRTITFDAAENQFPQTAGGQTLNINGPGEDVLTIDADSLSTVFVTAGQVTIDGVTISNGNAAFSAGGGAILNLGDLTVTNSTFSGNVADDLTDGGGAIANAAFPTGTLTAIDSTFVGNSALGSGGAIRGQFVTVISSTLTDNTAGGFGGGIDSAGNLHVVNSTLAGNSADLGGGIFSTGNGTVTNTTTAGNAATTSGGGVWVDGGSLTIDNSILAGNTAPAANDLNDSGAAATVAHSLIGDAAGHAVASGVSGNLVGVDWKTVLENDGVDPTLKDNGGATQTIALIGGGPAIDAGDNALAVDAGNNPLVTDQRGVPFDRVFNVTVDMGAVENGILVVDTDENTNDGDFSVGDLSLREAIGLANADPGPNQIVFDAAFFSAATPRTITFDAVENQFPQTAGGQTLRIDGPGQDILTIDADSLSTAFLTFGEVTLEGMTIINGNATFEDGGGAILNFGDLTVKDSTFSGNVAADLNQLTFGGGAIANFDNFPPSTLTAINSTFVGNSALESGGAIRGEFVTIIDSTITGNTAGVGGGGIDSLGQLTVTGSTISDNNADQQGGGITAGVDLTVTDSTIDGNMAGTDGGGIFYESFGGALDISGSTINDNTAGSGGGLFVNGVGPVSPLNVINATINDNTATTSGGGILNQGTVALAVINSTIAGNQASISGGGVDNDGLLTVTNSTIAGNAATASGGGVDNDGQLTVTNSTIAGNAATASGGGVENDGQLTVDNSIIAGNTAAAAPDLDDSSGAASVAHSLIGDASGHAVTSGTNGNLVGVDWTTVLENDGVDPILRNNGGPTQTIALIGGGPAIDTGDNALAVDAAGNPLTTDQRGLARIASGTVDQGAFEFTATLWVDTDENTNDGDLSAGDLSLREAIAQARLTTEGNTIGFDPTYFSTATPRTIEFDAVENELFITESLNINGPGADVLTIDARQHSRIFNIFDGNFLGSPADVQISGLTLTGGFAAFDPSISDGFSVGGGGGAILNRENLTLSDSRVIANVSENGGGGIWSYLGDLTVMTSEVAGNSAPTGGGVFLGAFASATITDSSLWGNSATDGGALAIRAAIRAVPAP